MIIVSPCTSSHNVKLQNESFLAWNPCWGVAGSQQGHKHVKVENFSTPLYAERESTRRRDRLAAACANPSCVVWRRRIKSFFFVQGPAAGGQQLRGFRFAKFCWPLRAIQRPGRTVQAAFTFECLHRKQSLCNLLCYYNGHEKCTKCMDHTVTWNNCTIVTWKVRKRLCVRPNSPSRNCFTTTGRLTDWAMCWKRRAASCSCSERCGAMLRRAELSSSLAWKFQVVTID